MKKSYRVAMGGMVSALAVISMFLTGFIPIGTYALPAFAGALLLVIALEFDVRWAYLVYIAVSILCLLVTPDREAAVLFVTFFGHYPTTKLLIERIHSRIIQWLVKFGLFNGTMILSFWAMMHLLGMAEIADEFGEFGRWGAWIFLLLGNIVFVLLDIALTGMKRFYLLRVQKKLMRK